MSSHSVCMGSRSQSNVFTTLKTDRLTCDYLHLNNTPIRVNGYPFGTADLPNTANFITKGSLQQADWLTVNPSSASFIRNKPQLSRVALTGNFADLANAPSAVPVNADWTEQDSTRLAFVRNKPVLSVVGTSGRYSDLVAGSGQPTVPTTVDYNATSSSGTTLAILNRPQIPPPQVNADWSVTSTTSLAFIKGKPSLSTVALSGSFGDLLGKPTVYQTVDWNASANTGTTLAIANRPTIPDPQVNADWAANTGPAAILNRPSIPAPQVNSDWNVATGAAAILNKPQIPNPQINSDWNASSGSVSYIANKPILGKVASSNKYGDLDELPTITPQQPSDWNATSGVTFIQNKPIYAAVASSGKYSDLLASSGQPVIPNAVDWSLGASTSTTLAVKNRPSIPPPQVQADWAQRDSAQISYINNRPNLATVATSGSYNDLINKPTTSAGVAQSDWTQPDSTQPSFIVNKPALKTVATTGKYSDLVANSGQPASITAADWNATSATGTIIPVVNKPILPAAQVNADWNSTSGLSQILNLPTFGAVAFSNAYADLSGKPPTPVNADWNSTSGLSRILNRPNLGLVATTNSYYDLSNLPTGLSAFTNDSGFYRANDSPTFGSTTTSQLNAGVVNLTSANPLYLASDLAATIDPLAGTLTYNPPGGACTPANAVSGSVDLVGAGTTAGSRLLNLWDSVVVQGPLAVTGVSALKGVTATTVSASGGLTAASLATGGSLTVTGSMAVAGSASTGALTANSLSTAGTLSVAGTASFGVLTATGFCNFNGGAQVTGNNFIVNTAIGIGTVGPAAALHLNNPSTNANDIVQLILDRRALNSTAVSALGMADEYTYWWINGTHALVVYLNGDVEIDKNLTVLENVSATSVTATSGDLSAPAGDLRAGSGFFREAITAKGLAVTGSASTGALTASGVVTANAGISVLGSNVLSMGSDLTKETNAGKIAYGLLTAGSLDVVGGGTAVGSRTVKIWDNVTVPGTFAVSGATTLAAGATVSGGNLWVKTAIGIGTVGPSASLHIVGGGAIVSGTVNAGALVTGTASTGALTSTSISTTGTASTGALTSTSISTTGTASTGALTSSSISTTGTASTGALTATSVSTGGTVTASGVIGANAGVNVSGSNVLNFGSNVTKESNAGKIGYGAFTVGSLDIVGAGTSTGSRSIRLHDNVIVNSNLSVNGVLSLGAGYSAANPGWTTLPGGLVMQWGSGVYNMPNATNAGLNVAVTLPKAYSTALWNVQVALSDPGYGYSYPTTGIAAYQFTTTSFMIGFKTSTSPGANASISYYWTAIGI